MHLPRVIYEHTRTHAHTPIEPSHAQMAVGCNGWCVGAIYIVGIDLRLNILFYVFNHTIIRSTKCKKKKKNILLYTREHQEKKMALVGCAQTINQLVHLHTTVDHNPHTFYGLQLSPWQSRDFHACTFGA